MGSRPGRRMESSNGSTSSSSSSSRWCVQPLTPLMEGPDLEMQLDELSKSSKDMMITASSAAASNNNHSSSNSWEVLREWFRVHKNYNNIPHGHGFSMSLLYGGATIHVPAKRQDLRLLLGVLGCPLAPIPLPPITTSVNNSPILQYRPHIIKDIPIETSTAQYIIQQYLAATGCLKKQQQKIIKNVYTTGAVKMICCETEIVSSGLGNGRKQVVAGGGSGGGRRSSGENGCFVLWQMAPGMWSLELVVGNGRDKVIAGSDGKIVWRHTPWLGTHAAKGPHRPLRRIIQGLDPKSTARLFGEAQCLGEKRIGEDDCFVLRVAADRAAVRERNEGSAEVIRHVLYGYFSQKSGLLIYMEDSHLTRVLQPPPPLLTAAAAATKTKAKARGISKAMDPPQETCRVVYWETTIGSSIGDYREVDGVLIAHGGRTIATVFRFGDDHDRQLMSSSSSSSSMQHDHQAEYSRTRMEEIWRIDDVVFNVPGLSLDSFIPPSDII